MSARQIVPNLTYYPGHSPGDDRRRHKGAVRVLATLARAREAECMRADALLVVDNLEVPVLEREVRRRFGRELSVGAIHMRRSEDMSAMDGWSVGWPVGTRKQITSAWNLPVFSTKLIPGKPLCSLL